VVCRLFLADFVAAKNFWKTFFEKHYDINTLTPGI
jgi:hypothetical protein